MFANGNVRLGIFDGIFQSYRFFATVKLQSYRGLLCEFPSFNWALLPAAECAETTLEVFKRAAEIKPTISADTRR